MRVLIVAAHADDEILGCGGTIAKFIELGHQIYVLICTRPYTPDWTVQFIKNWTIIQMNVDKYLGIEERFNLDYPTVHLNNIPHGDLAKEIKRVVDLVKPDWIFTHWDDLNYDHELVNRATQAACRPPNKARLYSYEVPSSTELSPLKFNPTFYISLSKNHLIRKFNAYKLYYLEIIASRSIRKVQVLAEKRGSDIIKNYAEAFVLIREVMT